MRFSAQHDKVKMPWTVLSWANELFVFNTVISSLGLFGCCLIALIISLGKSRTFHFWILLLLCLFYGLGSVKALYFAIHSNFLFLSDFQYCLRCRISGPQGLASNYWIYSLNVQWGNNPSLPVLLVRNTRDAHHRFIRCRTLLEWWGASRVCPRISCHPLSWAGTNRITHHHCCLVHLGQLQFCKQCVCNNSKRLCKSLLDSVPCCPYHVVCLCSPQNPLFANVVCAHLQPWYGK